MDVRPDVKLRKVRRQADNAVGGSSDRPYRTSAGPTGSIDRRSLIFSRGVSRSIFSDMRVPLHAPRPTAPAGPPSSDLPVPEQADGVDLRKSTPVAWLVTGFLMFLGHFVSNSGKGVHDLRLQSVTLLTLFVGILALAGTAQTLRGWIDAGRRVRAAVLGTVVLSMSVGVVTYGLTCYFG